MDTHLSIDNDQAARQELINNARVSSLGAVLENVNLRISDLSEAAQVKLDEVAKKLVNQGIVGEVSRENILSSHVKKTLQNMSNTNDETKLTLCLAEMNNEQRVAAKLSAIVHKSTNAYTKEIQSMTEDLEKIVGPTPLSPEGKVEIEENNSRNAVAQQKIMSLCRQLADVRKENDQLDEKLSKFGSIPSDVEEAKAIVDAKKREYREICDKVEDLQN